MTYHQISPSSKLVLSVVSVVSVVFALPVIALSSLPAMIQSIAPLQLQIMSGSISV